MQKNEQLIFSLTPALSHRMGEGEPLADGFDSLDAMPLTRGTASLTIKPGKEFERVGSQKVCAAVGDSRAPVLGEGNGKERRFEFPMINP